MRNPSILLVKLAFLWALMLMTVHQLCGQDTNTLRQKATEAYLSSNFNLAKNLYKELADKSANIDSATFFMSKHFRCRCKLNDANAAGDMDKFLSKVENNNANQEMLFKIKLEKATCLLNIYEIEKSRIILYEALQYSKKVPFKEKNMQSDVFKMLCFSYLIEGQEDSILYYNKINLEFVKENFPEDDIELGFANYSLANYYVESDQSEKAFVYLDKAFEILSCHYPWDHLNIGVLQIKIGDAHYESGNFDKAKKAYIAAINIFDSNGIDSQKPHVYNNLARMEVSLGHYQLGKAYVDQAIRYAKANGSFVFPYSMYLYQGLSTYEINYNKDYNKALYYKLQTMEVLLNSKDVSPNQLASTYFNIGYIANMAKDTILPFYNLNRALEIIDSNRIDIGKTRLHIIGELGILYFNRKDYPKALSYFIEAQNKYESLLGASHNYTIESQNIIIDCYLAMGNQKAADSVMLNASNALIDQGHDQWTQLQGQHMDILGQRIKHDLIHQRSKTDVVKALKIIDKFAVNKIFKRSLVSDPKDFEGYNDASNLIQKHIIHYLHAFYLKNDDYLSNSFLNAIHILKTNGLTARLDEDQFLNAQNVPAAQKEDFQKIRSKIRKLGMNAESENFDSISTELVLCNNQLYAIEEKLIKNLKINLTNVQKAKDFNKAVCENNKTVLFYYRYEDNYHCLIFNCDKVKRVKLGKIFKIDNLIDKYLNEVKQLANIKTIHASASTLYQALITPIEPLVSNNLLIISEGSIGLLNFEMLSYIDPIKKSHSWAIEKYKISYAVNLPRVNKVKWADKKPSVLIIAPGFESEGEVNKSLASGMSLSATPWTTKFAKELANMMPSLLLKSNEATKQNWLLKAKDYDIVHFGTHAFIDPSLPLSSYLAMNRKEDDLDFYSILSTHCTNDLIVLAACETAVGATTVTEETYSIAQAFQYAGAKKIIQSLWKIDDESTNIIFKNFYSRLLSKTNYNIALHDAKMDYLKTAPDNMLHPYYWAGVIMVDNELQVKPLNYGYLLFFGIALFSLIYFVFKKNRKI